MPAQFDTTACLAKSVSPDSVDVQEWYGAKEENIGAVQKILGASRVLEDRDFPPRLPEHLSSIPWLKVQGTHGEGWISGMDLPLQYHPGDSTTLLRSPFLPRDSSAALPLLQAWSWNGWTGAVQRMHDTAVRTVKRRWEILYLLVFDGVQDGDSLTVSSLPLGGSSGESPDDATTSWKITSTANGPRLVVRRTERRRSTTTTYRYSHRRILVVQ
jgi:hypothetical protein